MKKTIIFIVAILLCSTLSIIAYASYLGTIQATKVQYPIIVDETPVAKDIPMVSIEDRIYLPIRAMCEALGIGIEWNEEKSEVEIMTHKNETAMTTDKIELGYFGIDGWTGNEVDFSLTKESAVVIADDVLFQLKGKEFLEQTTVGVDEIENGKYYSVYRYKEPIVPGGDLSVIIRKSDGKIMRIVAGE